MEIPTDHIMDRIAAIQERIETIQNDAGASAGVQPGSFAAALQGATAAPQAQAGGPELDPDGNPVRPLGPVSADYTQDVSDAAAKYNIDPKLVQAVIQVESGGDPQAVSKAGAMGLMQLMPANIAEAGIANPFDPAENIDAGTRQLASLLSEFGGNLDLALAGYNAGPNAVKRYGGIPPYAETQDYVRKVESILDRS